MTLEHEGLTDQIIGAAIKVHRVLGPGFLESVYEKTLIIELRERGLAVRNQQEIKIIYDGVEVGLHRLDLLVEELLVVELKAISGIEAIHFAVVRSYLRATGLKHALILNFAKVQLDVRRVIAYPEPEDPTDLDPF